MDGQILGVWETEALLDGIAKGVGDSLAVVSDYQ